MCIMLRPSMQDGTRLDDIFRSSMYVPLSHTDTPVDKRAVNKHATVAAALFLYNYNTRVLLELNLNDLLQ